MATGIFGGPCVEKHTVYIFDRGGMTRLAQIVDVSSVRWGRDRDAVSEATVIVRGSACSAQAETLAAIEPKRHEMVIYRGADRVWEGPVWRVAWHADSVEINAHDVLQYVFGTPLSKTYDNRYRAVYNEEGEVVEVLSEPTEVTTRIEEILEYELQRWEILDPPANILPYLEIHHFPNEAKTTAYTIPYEMTVGEHMANLAHYGGIDYAAVGRSIHVWDVNRHLGRTRMITEADFLGSEVILTAYGSEHTQYSYVIGNSGLFGSAVNPNNLDYYGPWTIINTAYSEEGDAEEPTQAELDSQAQRGLAARSPVPVEVRVPDNSSIRLNETLTINDLVPGVQIPVLATLNARQMSQLQKLDLLTVTEDETGENVQVTLVPSTRDDDEGED